jgi:hypothetical protein
MVLPLLRARRRFHADDHRQFADAAQLLTQHAGIRYGDDNPHKKLHNVRGHSSANYRAEYGRSSAGQIRFVTKSGGSSSTATRSRTTATPPSMRTNGSGITAAIRASRTAPTRTASINGASTSAAPGAAPRRVQQGSQQAVFLLGRGMDPPPRQPDLYAHRADGGDAARRFQRAVEPDEPVLRPRPHDHRSAHRPAVPQQRRPARPDQRQRTGAPECVSAADARLPAGDAELDRDAAEAFRPAQGHGEIRLRDGCHPAVLGPRRLHAVDVQ